MIRRFALGTVLATGLALSVTGCLGDAGTKVDAVVLSEIADNTGKATSFKADLSMRITGASEGDLTVTGEMQYRTKPDLAFSMYFDQMLLGEESMAGTETVMVGGTTYTKLPRGRLPQSYEESGKRWLKMPKDESGMNGGTFQPPQQMDPVQSTLMLTASKDTREVGKEKVDGVETTRYTGTYDLEEAVSKLAPEAQERYLKSMASTGIDSMDFELWVDGQRLPRKLTLKAEASSTVGKMNVTMKYRGYGKPVQVKAPPKSQVIDMGELLENAGGGLPGA